MVSMANNGSVPDVQRAHWRATDDAGLLRAVLDVLEVGVALLDYRGQYLHRNRRFSELSRGAGVIPGLAKTIEVLLEELLPKARSLSGRIVNGPVLLGSVDVHVGSGAYRVRGLAIGRDFQEGGQALLITTERLAQEAERKLPEKLRLTVQEARVARLLAEGCTNKEIAAELGIHPTTAKNHTQNVLQKLGVRRRSQVGPLLRAWLPW
jgi:DNA-binding CsgD family transcriptional regulator